MKTFEQFAAEHGGIIKHGKLAIVSVTPESYAEIQEDARNSLMAEWRVAQLEFLASMQ